MSKRWVANGPRTAAWSQSSREALMPRKSSFHQAEAPDPQQRLLGPNLPKPTENQEGHTGPFSTRSSLISISPSLTVHLSKQTTEELYQCASTDHQLAFMLYSPDSWYESRRLLNIRLQSPAEVAAMETLHPCLAHCPDCKPSIHLTPPFNASLAQCPSCKHVFRIRLHPCRCHLFRTKPREPDYFDLNNLTDLRDEINASTRSDLAKSVLLAVAQVPVGRYTTFTALAESIRGGMVNKGHIRSALRKSGWSWEDVPVHRVLASNTGFGGAFSMGDHGGNDGGWREMLEDEGVRFSSNGRALGSAFCEFR